MMNVRMALAVAALGLTATGGWIPASAADSGTHLSRSEQPSAATYVEKASMADQFGIRASQTVLDKVEHLDVRQYARSMVDHHHQSNAYLKHSVRLANTPAPVPPPALNAEQSARLEELRAASRDTVDRLYLHMQIEAHEEALTLHSYYAMHGTDPALRQAAADMARLEERHLAEARRMAGNLVASAR